MVYIKSLLAGLAAVIIAMLLSPFVVVLYIDFAYKPAGNEAIGWDPISLVHRPPLWLVASAVSIFLIGFIWEFRRATPK
jgi:hypothetical protein